MRNILPAILAIGLLGLSSTGFAKTFSYVETYTPPNLYTEASSSNVSKIAVISDTDNTIYRLNAGQSLKIKLTIPPGVDMFSASAQVSKWKTVSTTGEFLYAKSMTDFTNVEDYNATFSTSFPFQFVNTAFSDSDVPISVVSNDTTTSQQTGYMIFDNTTTDDALVLKTVTIQFTVNSSMISTYNNWVASIGSSLPVTLNVDGGGTSSASCEDADCGDSGSVVDFSDPDVADNAPCSPLLGNCGTNTGSTSTDNTDTSTDNTDTSTDNTDTSTDNTDTSTDNTDTSTDNTDTSSDNTDTSTGTTTTGTTTTDGVNTGTYKVLSNSMTDSYVLWDSVVDDENSNRYIRVRIEKNQLDDVSSKLDDLDNGKLTPTALFKREQIKVQTDSGSVTLYPYSEDPEGLIDTITGFFPNDSAGITRKGVVYVIIDGTILFGYLDYYVTKPDSEQSGGAFSFGPIEVEDGLQVMKITYPSGVVQKMYFYSTPLPTVDN